MLKETDYRCKLAQGNSDGFNLAGANSFIKEQTDYREIISDRALPERPGHEELKQTLTHVRDRVIQSRPRHVYTDACFEPGVGSFGACKSHLPPRILPWFANKLQGFCYLLCAPRFHRELEEGEVCLRLLVRAGGSKANLQTALLQALDKV